eukprot:scaffold76274_cov61-Phaeocystis_antarctica.AAC.2
MCVRVRPCAPACAALAVAKVGLAIEDASVDQRADVLTALLDGLTPLAQRHAHPRLRQGQRGE